MLHEEVQEADFVGAEFGEFGDDVVGYEVGAAGARGKRELFLDPGHFVLSVLRFIFLFRMGSRC